MDGLRGPRQRRIHVEGPDRLGSLSAPLSDFTARLGHALIPVEEVATADLRVMLADFDPPLGPPCVAVSGRRVDASRRSQLIAAGVLFVLDADHGLLDLAFAYAEALFPQRAEQRRHALAYGRLEVEVVRAQEQFSARLVGLNRCGAWLSVAEDGPAAWAGGDPAVEIRLPLGEARVARLEGRWIGDRPARGDLPRLLAVELALGRERGFPSFRSLGRAPSLG